MATPGIRDELAELRARVAQLEADRRLAAPSRPSRRLPRRLLPLALAALLVALVPLATLAADPFTDLVPGSVHNANIDAIYNAGITTGCVPNAQYCPTDTVTRQEMASFIARAAGLGTNPPVANAKTAQTAANATNATTAQTAVQATNATTAQTATQATNATTVGGLAPNALLRVARSQPTSGSLALNRDGIPVDSVTITPPGAGFVLVTATIDCYVDPNGGRANYVDAWIHDTGATGAAASSPHLYLSLANRTGYAYTGNGTVTWVFPVTGTTPRTFQLIAAQSFDPDNANYNQVYLTNTNGDGGTVTALFVPFAQDGGGTLAP